MLTRKTFIGTALAALLVAGSSTVALAQQAKGRIYYLVPTLLDEFQTESRVGDQELHGQRRLRDGVPQRRQQDRRICSRAR